ncbi:phage GP46 family protein [Vibrio nigripulchritudo]|uniref:phage GP46 family protein n=1 Tax=Vibrio nigripulchritudo TaxID=28173 RepID=UPI0005FA5285|nr:phage GP46 family protein [Vibrio nigripulchritudo]KJY78953.1 hypothetical protein TW74_09625 [Vibrio nigripulchritudo]
MSHFRLNALTEPVTSKSGLTHAVLQSIYNHGESNQNDRARMGNNERGGTWSQELIEVVGSRDWTLKREKLTDQTLSLAKRFYEEALTWLVKEGHAKRIDVSVWREKPNQMGRNITITLNSGEELEITP